MKKKWFAIIFTVLFTASVYCKGGSEIDLVKTQEIELGQISTVDILSEDRDVFVYMGDSDVFVIKDYMNRKKDEYCADITSSGNELKIVNGKKSFLGIAMIGFKARLEVYLPKS
jgi:hypothetical protein